MLFLSTLLQSLPLPSGESFGGGITGGLLTLAGVILYTYVQKRMEARNEREKRIDEGDLAKQLQLINFKELSVKQQESVFNQSMQLIKGLEEIIKQTRADLETEKRLRREEVERERRLRETVEENMKQVVDELRAEIRRLEASAKTATSLLIQELKHSRAVFDLRNIACWQITPDGKVFGNITFFMLTGLEPEEAQGEGWFKAIDEGSPSENLFSKRKWRNFINDFQSRPVHKVRFRNLKNGLTTDTNVFFASLLETPDKPYLFIAYTDPIPPSSDRAEYERELQSGIDG
jgi:PAS domain-containing protein